ncbi:hypothetical protein BKA62DRAFT_689278 [Auriculariales sp. MPI-PUGE-AT-0066]|nr:hypothetical protein BKA62DRAFT_689278 [Auriculariales sp. MPI-PUGE-AT-0066]
MSSLSRPLLELALRRASLIENPGVSRSIQSKYTLCRQFVRRMHAVALSTQPETTPAPITAHALAPRRSRFLSPRPRTDRPPTKEQVQFKNAVNDLLSMPIEETEDALDAPLEETEEVLALSEEMLRAIYVDLLTPVPEECQDPLAVTAPPNRIELLEVLEARLALLVEETQAIEAPSEGFSAKLSALRQRLSAEGREATLSIAEPISEDAALAAEDPELTLESVTEIGAESDTSAMSSITPLKIADLDPTKVSASFVPSVQNLDLDKPWSRVLARLDIILEQWQQNGIIVATPKSSVDTGDEPLEKLLGRTRTSQATSLELHEAADADVMILPIGLSVVTLQDWINTIESAIEAKDVFAGDVALQLMERARVPIDENLKYRVINIAARVGNVAMTENMLRRYYTDMTVEAKHLHIKAYTRGSKQSEACRLLHTYEQQRNILPMKTYTAVISSLLYGRGAGRSQRNAQAWDLFAHMRYVAHPVPDTQLYSIMIKACGLQSKVESDCVRAMDLWKEMTEDHGLKPTVKSYDALIHVCCKNKKYLLEAFRLTRAMMDQSRDAHGQPHMVPTFITFVSLLQAAKRLGALSRAKWIFAEVIRSAAQGDFTINSIMIQQLFHVYATYDAPRRSAVNLAPTMSSTPTPTAETAAVNNFDMIDPDLNSFDGDAEPAGAPSGAQVLAEVEGLFNRIVEERAFGVGVLSSVEMDTRIGNAYLAVFSKFASVNRVQEVFGWLENDMGIEPDTRTYWTMLDRLINYMRLSVVGPERHTAAVLAKHYFDEWRKRYPNPLVTVTSNDALNAPTFMVAKEYGAKEYIIYDTERIWRQMIYIFALADLLDDSLAIVEQFVAQYPPVNIASPLEISRLRIMRTSLLAPRPLVRLSTQTSVSDDAVPPMLLWSSVELLHQNLLIKERHEDIRKLTYITNAYKGMLTKRRDAALERVGKDRYVPETAKIALKSNSAITAARKADQKKKLLIGSPLFRRYTVT